MLKTSEKELQRIFYEMNHTRYDLVVPNIHYCDQGGEMDIFCLRPSGFIDEIEIKLSASDFKADFRKRAMIKNKGAGFPAYKEIPKHESLMKGWNDCNYFSFLMPLDIISKCPIPSYSGLYVYDCDEKGRKTIRELRKPTRLHSRKISDNKKYKAARNGAAKYWYMAGAFKV